MRPGNTSTSIGARLYDLRSSFAKHHMFTSLLSSPEEIESKYLGIFRNIRDAEPIVLVSESGCVECLCSVCVTALTRRADCFQAVILRLQRLVPPRNLSSLHLPKIKYPLLLGNLLSLHLHSHPHLTFYLLPGLVQSFSEPQPTTLTKAWRQAWIFKSFAYPATAPPCF